MVMQKASQGIEGAMKVDRTKSVKVKNGELLFVLVAIDTESKTCIMDSRFDGLVVMGAYPSRAEALRAVDAARESCPSLEYVIRVTNLWFS